jgi:cell division septation protein DedD
MLGAILLIAGVILMAVGLIFLGGWVSGRGERAGRPDAALSDGSKAERQLMDLYFIAAVVAPLLAGAMLIAFGLQQLL